MGKNNTLRIFFSVVKNIFYFILNSFVVCADWLNWNTAWWKGNHPDGSAKRWRYALWDQDNTFGHGANYSGLPDTGAGADPCNPEDLGDPGDHEDPGDPEDPGHPGDPRDLRQNTNQKPG